MQILKPLGIALLCGLGALSGSGCRGSTQSAAGTIQGLYGMLRDSQVTGAPTPSQLTTLSPYLSTELHGLLQAASHHRLAEAAANPDEKPPFAEGDLFSSLFEGPTSFETPQDIATGRGARVAVRFRHERGTPPVEWTDTVVVQEEKGRLVVADVVYGGTWDAANRGSLLGTLRPIAASGPIVDPWIVRHNGIGPVRTGMRTAEVTALLGGTVRIDRVEDTESCGQAYFSAVPAGVSFMVEGDTIVRVDVDTTGIRNLDNVSVGDPESVVRDRFGPFMRMEPHPYEGPEGHYLVLDHPNFPGFRTIFETDGRQVTRFRSGRLPEVDLIEGCL